MEMMDNTDFYDFVKAYDRNKGKSWRDWLSFDQTFEKPGKQGLVGLMRLKDTNKKCVFKISQYINNLVNHERVVMEGLNQLSETCPHFARCIGSVPVKVDPNCRKTGNPFNITTKYPIKKDALLCEYISNSTKLYNYIRSSKIPEEVLYTTVQQVLLAIAIAQQEKSFSHYDLHSFNVMMKKCDPDAVFLYVLDEDNQFCVPTLGHYPVIIDFGFSYIEDMDDCPMWSTLAHTDVGFMSDRFDWVADPKLFLVSVAADIKEKRGKTKKGKKFQRIVKNLFFPLTIDWESGWDDVEKMGASDYLAEMLNEFNTESELFKEHDNYCVDLLQSLICLPLEEQNYSTMNKPFKAFIHEWKKIEDQITSPFYRLYILKGIIDAARYVRAAYTRKSTRQVSVTDFQKLVYKRLNEVADFCIPKDIHYEKMLCSLLVLAVNMEGLLYDIVNARMDEKNKEYSKLPLKSTVQIYGALAANIPDEYVWSSKTKVWVFDVKKGKRECFSVTDEIAGEMNSLHPLSRGSEFYAKITDER